MSASHPRDRRTHGVGAARPTRQGRSGRPQERAQDAAAGALAAVAGLWSDSPRWLRRGVAAAGGLMVLAVLLLPLLIGPMISLAANRVDVGEEAADTEEVEALPDLVERSRVVDAEGDEMAVLHGEVDRQVVELREVPEDVRNAVLGAEDRRFYEHGGYDTRAIMRAALANLRAGGVDQGASTISQQVVQQAHLDHDETLSRKLREVSYAVALEDALTKDEILERYLNEVYFGEGAYGIAAAAENYYRASPEELSVDQAALLAGLIRSPEVLDPRDNPAAAKERRNAVLDNMAEAGFITEGEADRLKAEPVEVEPPPERDPDTPYAVEAVKREFANLDELGGDPEQRLQELFEGGYTVHTTLDTKMQQHAEEVVTQALPPDQHGPTAALISIDPRSGAIRALHGGVDFEETKFDLATQGRRQPGSALKPFVAAAAFEEDFAPGTHLEGDSPQTFRPEGATEPWEVENFDEQSHGSVSVHEATVNSINTAFAQLVLAVGPDEAIDMADRLGVNADAAFGEENTWGPSIVLGGLTHGVTPLELATAFGTFADDGRRGPPYLIERVEGPNGEVLFERGSSEREQVLDPDVNAAMVEMLTDVVEEGTGTAAQLPDWEVLGKTGTTDDHTDAWFAGSTAKLSTTVWVGHPDDQVPMHDMTGGSLPAELWNLYMQQALEGQEPIPLPSSGDPDNLSDGDPDLVEPEGSSGSNGDASNGQSTQPAPAEPTEPTQPEPIEPPEPAEPIEPPEPEEPADDGSDSGGHEQPDEDFEFDPDEYEEGDYDFDGGDGQQEPGQGDGGQGNEPDGDEGQGDEPDGDG